VSETTLGETLSYVEVSVADSGIGIAAEDISRLLQPFVRPESGLRESTKAVGSALPWSSNWSICTAGAGAEQPARLRFDVQGVPPFREP